MALCIECTENVHRKNEDSGGGADSRVRSNVTSFSDETCQSIGWLSHHF